MRELTLGRAVTFAPNGDVGYAYVPGGNQENGGFSIGVKKRDGDYEFKKFDYSNHPIFGSSLGTALAFDDKSDVAFGTHGGGLTIGRKIIGNDYNFTNYNTLNSGLKSNIISHLAFDSDGNIGVVGGNNEFTLGIKQSNGTYTFKYFNFNIKPNPESNDFGSVGFNSKGDVILTSIYTGLTIGEKYGNHDYAFTNYTPANTPTLNSVLGEGAVFTNTAEFNNWVLYVAWSTENAPKTTGGLFVGAPI